MKTSSTFKGGLLSVIAGTAIFMASTIWAGDKLAVSGVGMELKPKVMTQEKLDVHELDEHVAHMEVIDSNGNVYLLVPIKSTGGSGPAVVKDGKIIVEYVHPYEGRLGN